MICRLVHLYGEYNVMYGPNGVDLSAFKRTSSGIDKPLERSFGSICKWLQRGFHNAREIREVLAIFSRDLMKDKLRAVGVSGRDLADDDDEYTLE